MSGTMAANAMGLHRRPDPRAAMAALAARGRGNDTMLAHINPREAAMLMRAGGSGAINPATGLPEFDDGGGGPSDFGAAPKQQPGAPTNYPLLTGFTTDNLGNYYDAGGRPTGLDQAIDPNTPQGRQVFIDSQYGTDNVPAGVAPFSAAFLGPISSQINAEPGTGGTGYNPLGTTADNNAFMATPGNPNFVIDPSTGYATGFTPAGQVAFDQFTATDAASARQNQKNVYGGFLNSIFDNPLSGIAAALGFPLAVGGAGALLGAEAGAGAGAGADLSAAMAADVPSAGAGAATTGGAGIFGGATPELADATLASTGLGSAVTGGDTGAASVAGIADAGAGATDVAGGTAAGAADALGAGSSTNPIFLGATSAQPVAAADVPFDVSTGATTAGAPAGLSAASVAPAGTAGADLNPLAVADLGQGEFAPGAEIYGLPSGSLQAVNDFVAPASGGLLGGAKAALDSLGNIVGSPIGKLVGAVAAAGGLAASLSKGNNAAAAIPGVSDIQQLAKTSQTQGGILQQYLTNGTLPPAVQASIDQATQDGITAIKSRYAAMGVGPGSSGETQDIARLKQNAVVQGATLADQLLQQGITETQLSGELYKELVNTNVSLNQATGQAISSLASALAGGGTTLKLAG